MQQTEKLKLNLIDRDDPFTPDQLNENTKEMEKVLVEQREMLAEELADMGKTLMGGLASKGTCTAYEGSYKGDGITGRTIELGFAPKLLLMFASGLNLVSHNWSYRMSGSNLYDSGIRLTATGFRITNSTQNQEGLTFSYVAFS